MQVQGGNGPPLYGKQDRMPRKTSTRKTASKAQPTLADRIAAAIAALPFAYDAEPTDANLYANLPTDVQRGIAESIAKDRAAGLLSGADLRTKYSGVGCPTNRGLSGPMRRKVLREHGFGGVVAKSYDAYADGDPRTGSAHARMHGPAAPARAAAALDALAESDADATDAKAQRAALREAKLPVPRDAAKLRAAYVAMRRAALAA